MKERKNPPRKNERKEGWQNEKGKAGRKNE